MTGLNPQQNVIGITSAQIALVTENTTTNYTIGTPMPLPQLKTLDVTVKSVTKEATAGFVIVDQFIAKQAYNIKIDSVNIPLDVIAAVNGSTLTQTGTAPDQVNTLVDASTDIPGTFNLAFSTDYINGQAGEFEMEYFAVKGLFDVVTKCDDYWTCAFTGLAMPRLKDNKFRSIVASQTAGPLPII